MTSDDLRREIDASRRAMQQDYAALLRIWPNAPAGIT